MKSKIKFLMNIIKRGTLFILGIFLLGFLIPQNLKMPVQGATSSDYNPESYWAYPWGKSVTHKGVDIFAENGTPLNSATNGIVLSTGSGGHGGNYVVVLGPKWRIHYYAHLNEISTSAFSFVTKNSKIGTVGDTGNAAGKPPHLHYAIITTIPYFWRSDSAIQGWKKMYYLNPIEYLQQSG